MSDAATGDTSDHHPGALATHRVAVRLALVVAIGVMVGAVFSTWHEAQFGGPVARVPVGTDFATFHGAAVLTLEGQAGDIYTPEVLGAKLAETTGYEEIASQTYGHPPFFPLAFLPLALLRFDLAYVVFVAAGLAALGVALARVGGLKPVHVLGIVLVSIPGYATVQLGQMGLWVGALLLAIFLALRRGNVFTAGLLLGLLAFKPLYAVGIGVWWLLSGRRYALGVVGAACSTAALVAAGWLLPEGWPNYLALLDSSGDAFVGGVAKSGFSTFEMWSNLLPDSWIAAVFWALTTVGIVLVFRRMVRQAGDELRISYALAVVLGLLISPRVGWYDWVLVVVPAVLLWGINPERREVLVVAGAWLLPTAALSWPVARAIENLTGVFVQLAPIVLIAVTWWWFRNFIQAQPLKEPSASGLMAPLPDNVRIK